MSLVFDRLKAVNLAFSAEEEVNDNIQKLFYKQNFEGRWNWVDRGCRHAKDALKKC